MTAVQAGDDPESCDECGTRHCVLRPVQLDNGDVELVCGDCFIELSDSRRVDRVNWRFPPAPSLSSESDIEEWNPAGSSYGLIDPSNPRDRYVHAENAADLEVWR